MDCQGYHPPVTQEAYDMSHRRKEKDRMYILIEKCDVKITMELSIYRLTKGIQKTPSEAKSLPEIYKEYLRMYHILFT